MPVTGDFAALAAIQRKLETIGREGAKRVAKQVALEAKALTAEGFTRGVAPSGQAWAPLKTRSGQPLRDSGRLASSITLEQTALGFTLSTSVAYADVHQRGATITAKKAKSLYSPALRVFFGKTVTIPARPFLPEGDLPAAWDARLTEAAEEAVEALFG